MQSIHGGMGWGGILQGCYSKIMVRSQQGQINTKQVKKACFSFFSTIMFTLDVYDGLNHT